MVLSIPIEIKEEKKEKKLPKDKKPGEEDVEEPEIEDVVSKSRPVIIEKIQSGLKIIKNPAAHEMPETVKVKFGYDVPRGNPVNSYQELDFDVSKPPIIIESAGVYFTKKEKNELEFEIENKSDFEIKLTGFDEKRDLFVKM